MIKSLKKGIEALIVENNPLIVDFEIEIEKSDGHVFVIYYIDERYITYLNGRPTLRRSELPKLNEIKKTTKLIYRMFSLYESRISVVFRNENDFTLFI